MNPKRALLAAAEITGLSAAVGRSAWRRARLLILCYHGISIADEHEAQPLLYVSSALFRRRLERIRDAGCRVLPFGEAVQRTRDGTLPPKAVAITFDDGTRDFAERAVPLLAEFGMPATLYLTTYYCGRAQPVFDPALDYLLWRGRESGADVADLAGAAAALPVATAAERAAAWAAVRNGSVARALDAGAQDVLLRRVAERVGVDYDAFLATGMYQQMTPEQIRALPRDLVDVQLHTHRHRTPRDRALFTREIVDNRASFARLGVEGRTPHFCYPSGDYWSEFMPWLRELGVATATTCVPGLASGESDPLLLPRFLDTSLTPDVSFDAWLSGIADLLPRRREHRFDAVRLGVASPVTG